MAEIMAVLFFSVMHYDPADPRDPRNDLFVLSKGHAAPILYAAWAEAGAFPVERLLTLRKIDSDLEGHPTPRLPFVDVATGSLGQGLPVAIGMALNAKRLEDTNQRVYVLLGDGESAEGSVWEAAQLATANELDNLCATIDVNRLGQSQPTMLQHDMETYRARWQAFGWNALVIDGHEISQLLTAYEKARETSGQPTVILARTLKGKGLAGYEDKENQHGKPLSKEEADRVIAELEKQLSGEADRWSPKLPQGTRSAGSPKTVREISPPPYTPGKKDVATRKAFGDALAELGKANPSIVVLDGDVKNSTYAEEFEAAAANRFFEGYIAEQNMVGMAMGLSPEGFVPFASSFACFLERAADFVRIAAYSNMGHLILCGSHAGVSIGEDGPSQMALEDLAMMRSILTSVVLYPSDGPCAERLVEEAIAHGGIVYIRTSRPKTKVIYGIDEKFPIGGCKVHGSGKAATIVGAGVTLFEALAAQEQLKKDGIDVRVVDAYSVKPLDATTLQKCADETGAVIVVEDHSSWGGLGDAVTAEVDARRFVHLAVHDIPRSASPRECLARAGIDAAAIVSAVKKLQM